MSVAELISTSKCATSNPGRDPLLYQLIATCLSYLIHFNFNGSGAQSQGLRQNPMANNRDRDIELGRSLGAVTTCPFRQVQV